MQTKGFILVITAALILVCAFYLSFNIVGSNVESNAEKQACKIAKIKSPDLDNNVYKDAYSNIIKKKEKEKTWLGYTYQEVREKQLGLGLDLKGGMNITLQISVPDILRSLSGNSKNPKFNQAIKNIEDDKSRQDDFVAEFCKEYKKLDKAGSLAQIFRGIEEIKQKPGINDNEVEQILKKEVNDMVENSYNVLRTRIDRFGVVAPNIQKLQSTGRIQVELPGVKEPERVEKLLKGAANLEFYATYNFEDLQSQFNALNGASAGKATAKADEEKAEETAEATEAKTEEKTEAKAEEKAEAKSAKDEPKKNSANGKTLAELLMWNTLPAGRATVGHALATDTAAVGEILREFGSKYLPNDIKLRWTVKPESYGKGKNKFEAYDLVALRTEGPERGPALGGDVVTDARAENEKGGSAVSMTMNSQGARKWSSVTEQNKGRQVAIVLDDQVYSYPNVNDKIDGGRSQITGNFTPEEANDLANVLKSGKMVASVDIASQSVIGPSLGKESIEKGLTSFVIALVLLMIFMICVYGFQAGGIAVLGLIMNLFFTFGILASFQSVLTLPGIAGIVLSLGMAVDANVLIFERIKEELRAGKSLKAAVADGYSNAFSAIFDSNLTSIITGAILAYLGTGPIKGFAVTLIIGICCSFFTAVFATRLVMEAMLKTNWFKKMTLTTPLTRHMMENVKFNFMGKARTMGVVACAVIVAAIAMFATRGLVRGIDFSGGRNYVVKFEKTVKPEALRAKLSQEFKKGDKEADVSVITINNDKTIRVSTNYKKNASGKENDAIESEVLKILYNTLKSNLKPGMTLEQFSVADEKNTEGIVSSEIVGPAIASDMLRGAIWAVFFSLLAMFAYILLRFRNVAFSVGALAAVAFTSFVVIAFYTLYGWLPFAMEIDQTFIAAVLTVIGYQVNDTVVVFDRVREFRKLYPKKDLYETFNEALSSTLARTMMTSITTLLVLLVIFFLGGATIRSFIFAMILGVIIGTLASLFIASPVAYAITKKFAKKNANKVQVATPQKTK